MATKPAEPTNKGKGKAATTSKTTTRAHPSRVSHDITAMMRDSNHAMATLVAQSHGPSNSAAGPFEWTLTPPKANELQPDDAVDTIQAARERWNGSGKPDDKDFSDVVIWFKCKLDNPHTSVQSILDKYFTPHDRDLLMPADPARDKALVKTQRHNRARYAALMETSGFAKWKEMAGSLQVKLTMLWLGLPVAPLNFQPGDSEVDDGWDDEEEEEVDQGLQPIGEPLRFLNRYQLRYFGDDKLRDEDPTYRGYYGFDQLYAAHPKKTAPLSEVGNLRGGGLDEDWDNMDDMDVDGMSEPESRIEDLFEPIDQEAKTDEWKTSHGREGLSVAGVSLRGGMAVAVPDGSESSTPEPTAGLPSATSKRAVDPRIIQIPPQHIPWTQRQQEPARSNPTSMRERTYAKIPSVHTENKIPVNAPPVEKILRFDSESLPLLSLGVLTPTEQRRLQIAHYEMRNVALERSQQCPYRGCNRVFAMTEKDRLQKHLEDVHMGDQCNFCDEVLWKHWSKNERRAHFLGQHRDIFLTDKDWKADNSFTVPSLFRVDWERESRYKFCPRCGRDHDKLNAHADRTHHDNVCYPGAPEGPYDWTGCKHCGGRQEAEGEHVCQAVINPEEIPYCDKCALPAGLFSDLYRGTHQLHCHGHSNEVARYCPWCGQNCGDPSNSNAASRHMIECIQRPDSLAEGPLDPETARAWPYVDNHNPECEGPGLHSDPPGYCPECKQAVFHLDAHLLQRHMEDHHEDKLDFCVFCKLDYDRRGWANDRQAKIQHLDDHIHDRKQTLANDLVQTRRWPKNHPYTKRAVEGTDLAKLQVQWELEHKDEQHSVLKKRNEELVKEMNTDKLKIQELRQQLQNLKTATTGIVPQESKTTATRSATEQGDKGKAKAKEPVTPAAKDKGKGKETETPVTKPATKPKKTTATAKPKPVTPKATASQTVASKITTLTPTSVTAGTAKKRKHIPQPPGPADPSYRPAGDEGDSAEEDAEFIEAEKIHQATLKRQKTGKKDPAFRPASGGPEIVDQDEEPVRPAVGKKKGVISQKIKL